MAAPKDLFVDPTAADLAVVLVDTSGSVLSPFDGNRTIWQRMLEVLQALPHKQFRLLFWNSATSVVRLPSEPGPFGTTGVRILPNVIKREALTGAFQSFKNRITNACLTYPHLAFQHVPRHWLQPDTPVILLTDGQMGYSNIPAYEKQDLQRQLAHHLTSLVNEKPITLSILTVEATRANLQAVEHVSRAAGSDVYRTIQDHRLTQHVTRFTTFNLDGSFDHIRRSAPPPGFLPWGDQVFSAQRFGDFLVFLALELPEKSEDEQLHLAQKLATTLMYWAREKPRNLVSRMVQQVVRLFPREQEMMHFLLTENLQHEQAGQATLLADYHRQRKDLFREANRQLQTHPQQALGLSDQFMSFPHGGYVVTGGTTHLEGWLVRGHTYPQMALWGQVPVLPLLTSAVTADQLAGQCLRQWFRLVAGFRFGVSVQDEVLLYLVLGLNWVAQQSPLSPDVKASFRHLVTIMWHKKRTNGIGTELARIQEGELPMPYTGQQQQLWGHLRRVAGWLHIQAATPFQLWLAFCRAYDEPLYQRQQRHRAHLPEELVGVSDEPVITDQLWEPWTLPDEYGYDYQCIVELTDVSATGGWVLSAHEGPAGRCVPRFVFSALGHERMLEQEPVLCPLCYHPVTAADFSPLGPRPALAPPESLQAKFLTALAPPPPPERESQEEEKNAPSPTTGRRTVILLRGVVGSGKSTAARIIQETVTARGGEVLVCCPDRFAARGQSMKQAIGQVKGDLKRFLGRLKHRSPDQEAVIVVDTCGERADATIFGQTLSDWTRLSVYPNYYADDMDGYLAWSLRNVLQRGPVPKTYDYWLNPVDAGSDICRQVHEKKARALFPAVRWSWSTATMDSLGPAADRYAARLSPFVCPV